MGLRPPPPTVRKMCYHRYCFGSWIELWIVDLGSWIVDLNLVILSTAAAPLCWLRRFKSKAGSSHCSGDNGDYGLVQILICTNTNTNTMTNTNTNHFLVPVQILHPKKYLLAISDFKKRRFIFWLSARVTWPERRR